jgi:hypothetical protein
MRAVASMVNLQAGNLIATIAAAATISVSRADFLRTISPTLAEIIRFGLIARHELCIVEL